ncbi:uncharacterized protein LOC143850683 [Tasmannia lanceolata]|uniref:uncharacterized protein LOC143850683 n=1 Tax=Tasmannia lanceolata TaxID=3420 RepID=UPI004063F658
MQSTKIYEEKGGAEIVCSIYRFLLIWLLFYCLLCKRSTTFVILSVDRLQSPEIEKEFLQPLNTINSSLISRCRDYHLHMLDGFCRLKMKQRRRISNTEDASSNIDL